MFFSEIIVAVFIFLNFNPQRDKEINLIFVLVRSGGHLLGGWDLFFRLTSCSGHPLTRVHQRLLSDTSVRIRSNLSQLDL